MTGLKIEVDGDPIPLQRPRAGKNRFYDPQFMAKKNFASEVMAQVKLDKPIDAPIAIDVTYVLEIPKSWSKKKKIEMMGRPHVSNKDLSNFLKFTEDSLNEKLWLDDAQIYSIIAKKMWGVAGKTIMEVMYDKDKC